MENPIEMDDLGVPLFSETSKSKQHVNNAAVGILGGLSCKLTWELFQQKS